MNWYSGSIQARNAASCGIKRHMGLLKEGTTNFFFLCVRYKLNSWEQEDLIVPYKDWVSLVAFLAVSGLWIWYLI